MLCAGSVIQILDDERGVDVAAFLDVLRPEGWHYDFGKGSRRTTVQARVDEPITVTGMGFELRTVSLYSNWTTEDAVE